VCHYSIFLHTCSSESAQQTQIDPNKSAPEHEARQGLAPSALSLTQRNNRETKSASPPPPTNVSGQPSGKNAGQEKHSGSSRLRNLFRKKAKPAKVESQDISEEKENKSEGGLPAAVVEGQTEEDEDETKRNVMDQIKLYNKKDSAVKPNERLEPNATGKEKRETRSASPGTAMPAESSEGNVDQEEKKTGLSKWVRPKKQRARSSSPEGLKSGKEDEKSPGKPQAINKHPLESVATAVEDIEEVENKLNVSDRIKKYNDHQKFTGSPSSATDNKIRDVKPDGVATSSHSGEEKKKDKSKVKSKGSEKKEGKENKTEEKNSKKGAKKEWNIFKRIGRHDSSSDLLDSDGGETLGVESSEADTLKEQELASDGATVKLISVTHNTEELDEVSSAATDNARVCKDSTGDERDSSPSPPPGVDLASPDDKLVSLGTSDAPGPMKPSVSVHAHIRKIQVNNSAPSPVVRRSLSVSSQMR